MAKPIASKVYDLYGRFYDGLEFLFRKRLANAIHAVPFRGGERILDIGVGTGLSLEFYPANVHVTGIDLSAGMLHQAQRKLDNKEVRSHSLPDQTQLMQADALNLPFADATFDTIVLSHVVTTVPNPVRCLREALRVAGEQACIVMVNHFRSPWPVISWIETAIDPICRKLGWRCDLALEDLLDSVEVATRDGKGKRRIPTKGFIFRTVYLQKFRDQVRIVGMPEAVEPAPAPELGTT